MSRAIDTDIQNIRNAVYGEEVRGSIIDALEQCYDDSTANKQIERIIDTGQETYDSIPQDYSSLTAEVSDLKQTLDDTDALLKANSMDAGLGHILIPGLFEHGNITNTGTVSDLKCRVFTKVSFAVPERMRYAIKEGFEVKKFIKNNETGEYTTNSVWYTESLLLNPGQD